MRKILILSMILLSFASFGKDYTKLFRNRIEADTLKAGYWLIVNGDTIHSVNPIEGQILKFTGGKYTNANPDALAADSMIFDKTTGILKIYKNGFATLQDTLDGRYPTYPDLTDSLNIIRAGYLDKATYDPAGIAQQVVGTTATQTLTNKTFTNPIITDFSGMQHDHSSAAQGGLLPASVVSVSLPVASSVAGRIAGAVSGVDYPAGWVLSVGMSYTDIIITHNLNRRVANVTVCAITGTEEQALFNTAAFNGWRTPDVNSLLVQSLATVQKQIKIYIQFK